MPLIPLGFPSGSIGKGQGSLACCSTWGCKESDTAGQLNNQYRRHKTCGFDPWVWKITWSRKWQPISVFSPEESHGQRSLTGYSPWGHKQSDIT